MCRYTTRKCAGLCIRWLTHVSTYRPLTRSLSRLLPFPTVICVLSPQLSSTQSTHLLTCAAAAYLKTKEGKREWKQVRIALKQERKPRKALDDEQRHILQIKDAFEMIDRSACA